jgi:tRNA(Ile)-lysidine synthase
LGYNLGAMLSDLSRILREECQIDPHKPVLVGVSGGADSLCIAEFMHEAGYSLIVAHFDHKLRPDSAADAESVGDYARRKGLRYITGQGDVKARAEKSRETIEEAARISRYNFLFKSAEDNDAQAVVVGHSADDQVETLLMHLLRGSGLNGLGGMPYRWLPNAWHTEIPLVRPLLGVWRADILDYCRTKGLDPVEDQTNEDPSYYRNRLRLELVPYLETFNPAARKLIWQTARLLEGERELIVHQVETAWSQCVLETSKDYVRIRTDHTLDYPVGMQRHIIRKAIAYLRPGLRDISFDAVQIGVAHLQPSEEFAEIDLSAGLKIVAEPGSLWVADWESELPVDDWPQVLEDVSLLEVDHHVDLKSGWQITARKTSRVDIPFPPAGEMDDKNLAWLDLNSFEKPLIVRPRREGDSFQPFGLKGHSQKISDFMVNQKIPFRARKDWPLVCSGDEILWVAGCRSAHPHQVTEETEFAVRFSLRRSDNDGG